MTVNTVIPNTFQTPNFFIDRVLELLEPEEFICLSFAVRHILGWRDKITDRRGRISLSRFEKGQSDGKGNYYGGTGLSRIKIKKATAALTQYGLLIRIGEPTQDGQEWELPIDDSAIKWDALETRHAVRLEKSQKRVQKAARASADKRRKSTVGGTTAVPPTQYDSRTGGGTTAVPEVVRQPYPKKPNQIQDQTQHSDPNGSVAASAGELPASPVEPVEEPPVKPKGVQPHVALIDAYLGALEKLGRKPIVKNPYGRWGAIAVEMVKAGVTPERVTRFVRAIYDPDGPDKYWQGITKPIPLETVAEQLPAWEAQNQPPPPPKVVNFGTYERTRDWQEHARERTAALLSERPDLQEAILAAEGRNKS